MEIDEDCSTRQTIDHSLPNVTHAFVALQIVPVLVYNPLSFECMKVNALLDDGSMRTFISDELRTALGLKGFRDSNYKTVGVGGVVASHTESFRTPIFCQSVTNGLKFPLIARSLPEPVGDLPVRDWNDLKHNFPAIAHINFPEPAPGKVHMLIGSDNPQIIGAQQADVIDPAGGVSARHCAMGWAAYGPWSPEQKCLLEATSKQVRLNIADQEQALHAQISRDASAYDKDLRALIEESWDVPFEDEDKKAMTLEERHVMRNIKDTRIWTGQRYQVGCTWLRNEPKLLCNRKLAEKRQVSLENSAHWRDDFIRKAYIEQMEEYLKKGYTELVPKEEQNVLRGYFLPHFCVVKN